MDLHFVNAGGKQTVPRVMNVYKELGVRCVGIVDIDVLNDQNEFLAQLDTSNLQDDEKKEAVQFDENWLLLLVKIQQAAA